MITPRCDIFYELNLISLKHMNVPIEYENELEEYTNVEEKTNTIKAHITDELKEIYEKIEEIQ